jgi:FtsH-binding integral membrane protein
VTFVPFQRVMALLMALALAVFIVPIAVQRHQFLIAAIVICVFCAYIAFNAWLFVRMRRSGKP